MRGKDGKPVDPRCYFCGIEIDPVFYTRAMHDGISYAVCSTDCPKWWEGALFFGYGGPQWGKLTQAPRPRRKRHSEQDTPAP